MSKPPKLDLASIIASAATPNRKSAEIVQLDVVPAAKPAATTLKQRAKQMSVYLEPAVYDQLRELAFAERTKMHGLMLEALDLLFKQRGARSIEQISEQNAR